jgi:hypothetical protein
MTGEELSKSDELNLFVMFVPASSFMCDRADDWFPQTMETQPNFVPTKKQRIEANNRLNLRECIVLAQDIRLDMSEKCVPVPKTSFVLGLRTACLSGNKVYPSTWQTHVKGHHPMNLGFKILHL